MPNVDGFTTTMRDHLADCYQACGLSPAGAVEVANEQAPSSPVDQAMLTAYNPAPFQPAPFPGMVGNVGGGKGGGMPPGMSPVVYGTTIPSTTGSGPYVPTIPSVMKMMNPKKASPPPGLQTAPSQTEVVSMG